MNRLVKFIDNHASGKKVLILFLLTNIIYVFMLTLTIPAIMAYSGDMKLLDIMPLGYDSEYIKTLFNTLGANGRNIYLSRQIPADMIYPFLFAISYCLVLGYFLKIFSRLNSLYFLFCLLPLIAGVADYMENIGIIAMLISYPSLSETTMTLTSIFTVIKSMATSIYFVVLIITTIAFTVKTVRSVINQENL